MTLKINKKQAIKILEKRKSEINKFSFDSKVWKIKTENDLREIFGIGDTKYFQINGIDFETYDSTMKEEILKKGKKQASALIDSYIELILEYT